MSKVTVDTSVIVEYIDEEGEFHEEAEAVFLMLITGKLEAIIPHPILAETYYVSTKIYSELEFKEPEKTSFKLIKWLYQLPTVTIPDGLNLAMEAGRVKLRYGLALTDCYVLATSKTYGCKALFRKRGKEMLEKIDLLEKEYPILFLEDYR